jgi:hypothetical protein
MNIDAKILNKIIANGIKNISERSSTMTKWLHPRDAGVVQHTQIYKCNTAYQ